MTIKDAWHGQIPMSSTSIIQQGVEFLNNRKALASKSSQWATWDKLPRVQRMENTSAKLKLSTTSFITPEGLACGHRQEPGSYHDLIPGAQKQ